MTVKEYLLQYRTAKIRADILQREYDVERAEIDSIRSPLGGDNVHSGEISRSVEVKALKLAEKAEALKDARAEALRIRQEILELILSVPNESGQILYERFINLKSWGEVADTVGYSRRQTFRHYERGLHIAEKKFMDL